MKRTINVEELKSIQLNILLALDCFCTEHQIKYSLAAGTLIGAVRHKGFIPWDDDIDVYILREDYNKLVDIFPQLYQGKYSLVCMERNKMWHRAFAKMCDDRTVLREDTQERTIEMGVSIDVFPIDDVPDNFAEWTKYNKRRKLLRDSFIMKYLKLSSKRSVWKNLFILVSKIALLPFSYSFLAKKMNSYCQKNNGKGYSHLYETCLGAYNTKYAWKKSDFDYVQDAKFEGYSFKIMSGYDDYLKTIYGDYMQLPPIEKRVSHHVFKAYWK